MNTKQTWKIGDCLDLLPSIPDKSIDMILTDLPYGTTACSWDTRIDLDKLWIKYKRVIKYTGAIVLTSSQPFTSVLVMSNLKMFRYSCVWEKNAPSGFLLANNMPLRLHEDILIFSLASVANGAKTNMNYYPIMKKGKPYKKTQRTEVRRGYIRRPSENEKSYVGSISQSLNGDRYPTTILHFNKVSHGSIHPTQKPIALFEYLIKTYTNEGDWVHDSCLGSGTTLEACMNTNRNCIGFEISDEWVPHYKKRLKLNNTRLDFFVEAKQ